MKRRNAHTLEGGENMQQTSWGTIARYLMAVLVVVSSLTLMACPGDEEEGRVFNLTATPVPLDATTGAALVTSALQGQAITIPNGQVFGLAAGTTPTLTFTAANMFSLTSAGSTATGEVSFASCTFTPRTGTILTLNVAIVFPTCSIGVTANNVVQGGGAVTGTVTTLILSRVISGVTVSTTGTFSTAVTVNVSISATGAVVVNNVTTPVNPVIQTGVSGVTGG